MFTGQRFKKEIFSKQLELANKGKEDMEDKLV